MKGLDSEIAKKNSSISELKLQLKEANEKQQATQHMVSQLKEQVRQFFSYLLKSPYSAITETCLIFWVNSRPLIVFICHASYSNEAHVSA